MRFGLLLSARDYEHDRREFWEEEILRHFGAV
jgi:hypothetical protein